MNEYLVTWQISITADTEQEAAKRALEIQRDPSSTATIFQVAKEIDLDEEITPLGGLYDSAS